MRIHPTCFEGDSNLLHNPGDQRAENAFVALVVDPVAKGIVNRVVLPHLYGNASF